MVSASGDPARGREMDPEAGEREDGVGEDVSSRRFLRLISGGRASSVERSETPVSGAGRQARRAVRCGTRGAEANVNEIDLEFGDALHGTVRYGTDLDSDHRGVHFVKRTRWTEIRALCPVHCWARTQTQAKVKGARWVHTTSQVSSAQVRSRKRREKTHPCSSKVLTFNSL